ncbi:MAG: hypothetical protein A3K19_21000 [Lentisphaerae bacterium RIFOXYB12_FULL_65_16]|nr:MAG: hypothetical protein A3K18_16495 [Lentisphaerae bacterium RIFOXYA12_64_32]OGV84811.1 MAG: hypothetical protein A3K19_21000 [Lentisphaerae bacterium RIFOXYB12_FULL_65_16]
MLAFDTATGSLSFQGASGASIWTAVLLLEDGEGAHAFSGAASDGRCVGQAGPWSVTTELPPATQGMASLRLRIAPVAGRVLKRAFLQITPGAGQFPPLNSTATRMLVPPAVGGKNDEGLVVLGNDRSASARLVTLLFNTDTGMALLFGTGSMGEDFSFFEATPASFKAGWEPQRELHRDTEFCLVVGHDTDPFRLLDLYATALQPFARPASFPATGWNTWDYYGGAITMADVRRELSALRSCVFGDSLKYAVLDMGWECGWGDWQPNRKFAATLRGVARMIESSGFVPGVWTAPLLCDMFTPLARHRQDLFARTAANHPVVVGGKAVLDFTLPEVQELLAKWFGKMRDAGFRLFKIDYIYTSYIDAMQRLSDPTTGKAEAIRRGLKTIRAAIGEDSHLINCGAPAECAIGIADSARVSTDIHTFWGHVKHNALQVAASIWQNGRIWTIDPDFALIRCDTTSVDPYPNYLYTPRPLTPDGGFWMAGHEASRTELQTWLSIVRLTGGNLFLADSICRLTRKGIDDLKLLFPPLRRSATPLDLFLNPVPRFWYLPPTDGERGWLGVFNWDDEAAPLVVPPGLDVPDAGFDVWTGSSVRLSEIPKMAPHSALLMKV